jgi:Ca2+-binding RTX toxin-like protein
MSTTVPPLTAPASIFVLDWSQAAGGKFALEIWVKRLAGDTRGVIEAAFEITLDSNDASLATGSSNYTLPTGWTGLVGGSSTIIVALFNSTESAPGSGQQVFVDPVFEASGEHQGQQKLVSLLLDVKPLVSQVSPIKVVVDTFTDSLGYTYPSSVGGLPTVLPDFTLTVPGLSIVKGDAADNVSLDASVAAQTLVFGLAGNDTAINLSSGDAFIGGAGTDTARFPNAQTAYSVKLASSHVEYTLGEAIRGALAQPSEASDAGMSIESGAPLFAVLPAGGVGDPVFVQAEGLQFGASTSLVNPLRMLNTGTPVKLVDASDPLAFASVRLALASAVAGDTIIVSHLHDEGSYLPLEVAVNDLRVLLLNPNAGWLAFHLKESAAVERFTLMGDGPAGIRGNSHANLLIGNDADNVIDGGAGNDSILGLGGDDQLQGGAGADWLDGGDGWDTVSGGSGNDILLAEDGGTYAVSSDAPRAQETDALLGGSGADLLIAAGSYQAASIRMMGGSGADVFRLMSLEGVEGSGEADLQGFRVHVADLSLNDGIDLSAFVGGSAYAPDFSAFSLAGRVAAVKVSASSTALTGDTRVSLDELFVHGLEGPVDNEVGRTPAPFAPVAPGSALFVSLVAGQADLTAALQRSDVLQAQAGASYSSSMQETVDAVSPIYFEHGQLLSQLVLDLSPVG